MSNHAQHGQILKGDFGKDAFGQGESTMRLTTKGRYGVRLVLDIAQHEGKGPVSITETSLRQDISLKYLERLVGQLQRAGFVRSVRGREGGHVLAMPPEKITLGSVVRALEGDTAVLVCTNNRLACPRSVHCVTRSIWIAADQAMYERLNSITVRDILEDGQNCVARKMAEGVKAEEAGKAGEPGPAAASVEEVQARPVLRKKLARRIVRQRLATPTPARPERPEGMPRKIMVVDDDPEIVDYLVTVFQERGYDTCTASDGDMAMEVLLNEYPDLITLDLEMPGAWGPRFSRKLSRNQEFSDLPVIVISGLVGIHLAIPRAIATLHKPFDPEELVRIVEGAIGPPN
jgi:Rrf2 family protein